MLNNHSSQGQQCSSDGWSTVGNKLVISEQILQSNKMGIGHKYIGTSRILISHQISNSEQNFLLSVSLTVHF